jgi:D-glycero-D-manno-heptose 1,7-bisphosphate phosphatase
MNRQLAELGVTLDGIYVCTLAPTGKDRLAIEHPDRKPGPGLLLRAAKDLHLDLAQSWMIGDEMRDVLAGHNAGCRGCILLQAGAASTHLCIVMPDLAAAMQYILQQSSGRQDALIS